MDAKDKIKKEQITYKGRSEGDFLGLAEKSYKNILELIKDLTLCNDEELEEFGFSARLYAQIIHLTRLILDEAVDLEVERVENSNKK